MWWKIYFWIFVILNIIGIFVFAGHSFWTLADWFEIVTSILAVIGVYAYIYNKNVFNPLLWKIFLFIVLASWGFNLLYAYTPLKSIISIPSYLQSNSVTDGTTLMFSILLGLPSIYAIYKLAYKK